MVVQDPDGTLFVSGYGSQVTGVDPSSVPKLWRSDDQGASWQTVDVGNAADGATGNSDVDLTVAADGTLYFASMGFDRSVGEGTHIAIGVSSDAGRTWRWSRVSESRYDDRPWVRVAAGGTAHVIWNDGSGVRHALSRDSGVTWHEQDRVHPEGGSSHFAVGPGGELAVRISPISASGNVFADGVDLVAVSVDGGETWVKHSAPGERVWDPTFRDPTKVARWVEPLAWSEEGDLYHLWSEGAQVLLARSHDRGESWTSWPLIDSSGEEGSNGPPYAYFPYMVTGPDGTLAATWFDGTGEGLAVRLAYIEPGEGVDPPRVVLAAPFQPDSWVEGIVGSGEVQPARHPAGEYVPVLFLTPRVLAVVTPIQDSANDRWGFTWWAGELR